MKQKEEKDQLQLTVQDWAQKNKFMIALKKSHQNTANELISAMSSYSSRIMNRLNFIPNVKINDNLKEIAEYIVSIPALIKKLLEAPGTSATPPFQIDLLVAVKGVTSQVLMENKSEDDDEDDDTN